MKATLNWQGDLAFTARADSGHEVSIDGPPALGGQNTGSRPMELLLMSVGGCSSMDVMTILKKARQDLTDCRIEVEGQRDENAQPKAFTDIHLQFILTGRDLNEKHVSRAVALAVEKYCSAIASLAPSVKVTHGYTIQAAD